MIAPLLPMTLERPTPAAAAKLTSKKFPACSSNAALVHISSAKNYTMAEVTFAKQFLAQLDARPSKRSSDWVADARRLPAQPPFTLPKPDVAYPAPASSSSASASAAAASSGAASSGQAAPGATGVTVSLKPLRGTPTTLPPVPAATTSIYDIKALCAKQTGYAPDKIKVLWERKPVPDAKTLAEVLGTEGEGKDAVELGVMFVGQPTAIPQPAGTASAGAGAGSAAEGKAPATDATPVAQGESGADVMKSPQFWRDLEGFVLQRVRDEAVGKEAVDLWKKVWTAKST